MLVTSPDQELTWHLHPDDFTNMTQLSPSTKVFSVPMNFTRSGLWNFGVSFLYFDTARNKLREGVALADILVYGEPSSNKNITRDYRTLNRFRTYPVGDNDVFTQVVDTKTNIDSESGIIALFQVNPWPINFAPPTPSSTTGGQTPLTTGFGHVHHTSTGGVEFNFTQNNDIQPYTCTYFYLSLYDLSGGSPIPATAVPYLAAPVHFTMLAPDGAVFHAHGTWLPADGSDFPNLVTMMSSMTEEEMNAMTPDDPMYDSMMGAMMIGVGMNNSINCATDAGVIMAEMPDMDMNVFYGPSNFSIVTGIFDFPEAGNWTIFAYMKVKMPSGEIRMVVPHFQVKTKVAYYPPPVVDEGDLDDEEEPSMSSSSKIFASVAMLLVALLLVQ